ncbi:tetratricopeptide repeat protein [Namhaeicola litoreus]|uniref:Tetratricopeptide repeat protein n=1 Tax=Namhaeicola litoreus TaxID=1052145 RepID=A0ABW3XZP4_9FLAO
MKRCVFLFSYILTFCVHAQEVDDLRLKMQEEQQTISFDTFFFEALKQKTIGNFDKAIYALEECQDIDPKNLAVLFEFSKNYFELNKYTEAEYYATLGLEIDPKNIYLLRHLKEINLRQNDFEGAVMAQSLIVQQYPEEEPDLIFIFLRAGKIDEAKSVLIKLDSEDKLPDSFASIKQSLLQDKTQAFLEHEVEKPLPLTTLAQLRLTFREEKTYAAMTAILENELKTKQYLDLLEDSTMALEFFPAQPFVYLMNGLALNSLRKYEEAISVLNSGFDMIVENPEMESKFFEQLSLAHKAMGDKKKAAEYYQKMLDSNALQNP